MPAAQVASRKREDVVAAASDLFGRQGYAKTSLREISATSHTSTATIYAHFEDKSAILDAVIDERVAALRRHFLVAIREKAGLEALVAGIAELHTRIVADPILARLATFDATVSDRRVAARVQRFQGDLAALALPGVELAVATGELECDDPEALLALVVATLTGWLLQRQHHHAPVAYERVLRQLLSLLDPAG
jgi:AcrR family transcriptional regulator